MVNEVDYSKYNFNLSRKKMLIHFIPLLFCNAIAYFMIMEADKLADIDLFSPDPYAYWICGWVIFVIFGLILLPLWIKNLINPRKLLYLNEKGFWHKVYGFIEWENLAEVAHVEVSNISMIEFTLKNPDEVLAKLSSAQKMFLNGAVALNGTVFTIPLSAIDVKPNELVQVMTKHIS